MKSPWGFGKKSVTDAADETVVVDDVTASETETVAASRDDNAPVPAIATGADEPVERRRSRTAHLLVFVVLPIITMIAAGAVGALHYRDSSLAAIAPARESSVQAARDATVAILSYHPDTVEKDLDAAQSKLTGEFKNSYASLTKNVVIPGAKQKHISAEASVPAAASVSASDHHAVVLVFVNQITIVGNDAPTSTTSSVRVTLERTTDTWLVSGFDPI